MKIAATVVFCLVLAGCSTAPQPRSITRAQTYAMPKDAVWQEVMAWFTSNQIQIKTIEKDSGVVYAERLYDLTSGQADCGEPGVDLPIERLGQFNVFVREADANHTEVTVNANFIERRRDGWTGAYKTINCVSTGGVESSILGAIQ